MSKRKHRYQPGVGNLKPEEAFDPFPKAGLVKQYEPFIRKRVGKFCKKFPNVSYHDALFEAVQIALEFEPKFDPKAGNDFSTPLREHLKGLQRRLHDREWKEEQHRFRLKSGTYEDISEDVLPTSVAVPASPYKENKGDDGESIVPPRDMKTSLNQIGGFRPLTVDEEIAAALQAQRDAIAIERRFAEEILPTELPEYGTGGNATHVAFDVMGAIVGLRLYDGAESHVRGVVDRLSPDLRALLGFDLPRSRLGGAMRAVIAHNERRQREADQEAENQRNGDYGPVFFGARDGLRPGIKFREPKKRTASRPDIQKPVSEAPDLNRLDPLLREVQHADRVALLVGAAEALRPSLDDKERPVLDWLLNPGRRNLTALAKEIDITKGYASKLRGRVIDLLRKQMTVAPEKRTLLIGRGCEILVDKDMAYLLHKYGRGSITWPWRK